MAIEQEAFKNGVSIVVSLLLFVWAVVTTILGLYLSWYNNKKQNTRIISALESIEQNTRRDKE